MKGGYKLTIELVAVSKEQKEACMRLENLICIVCLYRQFFFALSKETLRKICT